MRISSTFVKKAILLFLAFCFMIFLAWFILANTLGGSDRGSIKLAKKWRAELLRYQSPEHAKSENPAVLTITLESGEWIIGHARDSHGNRRTGGTIVTKDSRGRIRFFCGHVCGGDSLFSFTRSSEPANTLEQAYQHILGRDRREFFIDD